MTFSADTIKNPAGSGAEQGLDKEDKLEKEV